jgi:glycosyltransferase involved in cell wall biosynthesis
MNMAIPGPRLTLGLPTYNGERFLAAALDDLLAQTFTDFELIISDNASTDGTRAIGERYEALDPRVRYVRHPTNLGSAENHNFVIREATGEFFKWASDDDLYAPDLLQRCVDALDARPEIVLAHAGTAFINEGGEVIRIQGYPLTTDVPSPSERFRSLLYTVGGDDIYGVIRTEVLHRMPPHGSFHLADRVFVAELALNGRFHQIPEPLYFRRDHPGRAERASAGIRRRCVNLDPRRSNRWLHPAVRLLVEYIFGYLAVIRRAPISWPERGRCTRDLTIWVLAHFNPLRGRKLLRSPDPAVQARGNRSWVTRITRIRDEVGPR